MPFDQIRVCVVGAFVGGQFSARRFGRRLELFIPFFNDRQRAGVAQVETISKINDRADDKWLVDFARRRRRILLQELRPGKRPLRTIFPKVSAGAEPIVSIPARRDVIAAAENLFADLLVTAVIAENERSGEHQAMLPIVRAHLVLLGDEAVLVQKRAGRRRRLVDLLRGLVHFSNFVLDLARGALGNDGDHAPK